MPESDGRSMGQALTLPQLRSLTYGRRRDPWSTQNEQLSGGGGGGGGAGRGGA